MPQWRLNPLNDFLFYKIMGEKGDEVQLLGFINAVLGKTGAGRFTSVEVNIPRRRAAGYVVAVSVTRYGKSLYRMGITLTGVQFEADV